MNRRLRIVKSVLWGFVGVWVVVTVARFLRGLGPTTGLSDAVPWGLWIALDVMAGVALAAGGFVVVATVYLFGLERYRPFVRPAILTAFLGYVAVAVGLLYDLGLPWHIWYPILYPQYQSVLFEVAMCVMLYLAVLALEFAPVALEHPWFGHPIFRGALTVLKKATLVLLIAGVILSTLHQSSLGSLFLIAPYRLDPLWYTPIIYVLFFISAVGLGLMTVTMESLLSGWLFGHKIRTSLLSGLGLAASVVLGFYAAIRLGDVAVRGVLGHAFDGSWQGWLFLFETLVCAILPAVLLAVRRIRLSAAGLGVCSAMTIFGMVLNRLSVCILAFERPEGMTYFPAWTEFAITLGIMSAMALVFVFFVENLKVYPREDRESISARPAERLSYDPATLHRLTPESIAATRRYSLIAVTTAAFAVAFLPKEAVFGPQPVPAPVFGIRTVEGFLLKQPGGRQPRIMLASHMEDAPNKGRRVSLMMIDGNRNGRLVLFTHKRHIEECGGEDSCAKCHHQNMPFDENTSCYECHRDMYEPTDIFDHAFHVTHLGGNDGCKECHVSFSQPKMRQTAKACLECHKEMLAAETFAGEEQEKTMTGIAPGYMKALHRLCIGCHRREVKENPQRRSPAFARCDACHGNAGDLDLRRLGPYAHSADSRDGASRLAQAAPLSGGNRSFGDHTSEQSGP